MFPGQQNDEKILYVIRPHFIAKFFSLLKTYLLATLLVLLSLALWNMTGENLVGLGMIFGVLIAVFGTLLISRMHENSVSYLTDRRLVRFEQHSPFNTSTRSLSWDDVLKVKTYPPNMLWSMFNVGTVVLHARSSIISFHQDEIQKTVAGDDLDIRDVYYYKDLGNYIDKILYLNRHNPGELKELRQFVPKPRGQRY
jgi:hypothetical protein